MNLSKFIAISLFLLGTLCSQAQETALWTRYPAISPDGQTIAFNYKGDIYTVNSQGGRATQLTTIPATTAIPAGRPTEKQSLSLPTGTEGWTYLRCPPPEVCRPA